MTYEQFKNKYNGKYIDYDGAYGCQCWDLAQFYFTEVLNVPDYVLAGCGNVCNMLWGEKRELLDEYFDEVSIYEMCAGDVTIWESNHIAIFDNWDGNQNWYFSQNPNPCEVINCELSGLHAFRRKRETPPLPAVTPNVERDEYKNQIEEDSDYEAMCTFLDEKGFWDWAVLPDGSDAYSDYGLEPLYEICVEYDENKSPEEIIVFSFSPSSLQVSVSIFLK